MSDYEDRVQQQITRSLVQRLNFEVTASLETFAHALVSGAIRKWSRRPWMRPPTQTGRRRS